MKKNVDSTGKVVFNDQVFQKFTENEILSMSSMNRIRGGDGGEEIIMIPPPPKP
jgi:hypothetical protein